MKISIAKSATHATLTWSIPLNEDPNILVQRADGQGTPALQGKMFQLAGEHDIGDPNGVQQLAQITFGRPHAPPHVAVRLAATVVAWKPGPKDQDYPATEKARRLKIIGVMATRAYSTIKDRGTDFDRWAKSERANIQAQLDAGIGPFTMTFNPPADPAHPNAGWKGMSDPKVARHIDTATPKDGGKTSVLLENEVTTGLYWPGHDLNGAVARAAGISRELQELGWKPGQIGAPSISTPDEAAAKALCAAIELGDPLRKLFGIVAVNSYSNSPAFARPAFAFIRAFADRTGRKFVIPEAGLLAQHVNAANFRAMLTLWLDPDVGADATYVWLSWLLDDSQSAGTIGMLDADGNPTADMMPVWRDVTALEAIA